MHSVGQLLSNQDESKAVTTISDRLNLAFTSFNILHIF